MPALILSLALGALAFAMQTNRTALGPIGLALGAWVLFGALTDLWARTGREGVSLAFARLGRLPRSDWERPWHMAALGSRSLPCRPCWPGRSRTSAWCRSARPSPGAYEVRLDDVREVEGQNYQSTMGFLTVTRRRRCGGRRLTRKNASIRWPRCRRQKRQSTTAILRDIYIVLGDRQQSGGWAVRSYIEPFANWLWAGCILMALGGAS